MPRDEAVSRRRALQASGVAISASLAGCIGGGIGAPRSDDGLSCSDASHPFPNDWPLVGYDRRNTSANPNARGPRKSVTARWQGGGYGFVRGAPTVADDTVLLRSQPNHLHALSRKTGEEVWTLRMGASDESNGEVSVPGALSTPTIDDDTVYVGGGNFELRYEDGSREREENHVYLYAVDRRDGEIRWTVQPDDYVHTAPLVVDDAVLFVTRTGTVYAVDSATASVEWTFSVEGVPGPVVPTPAIDDCRLYVNTSEDGLYAIDVRDGRREWRASDVRSRAAPAVAGGTIYVGTVDGKLRAVDAADGAVEWTYELGGAVAWSSPAVSDGCVFVGDASGESGTPAPRVHAVDAETGEERWTVETEEYVKSSPAVADGVAYVAARDEVYGFDAETGEELWRFETRGGVSAPLSVADGTVYAATADGQLYALAESDEAG